MKFVALLRGINVGGNNIISKEQLRELFLSLGFNGVRTYIQSGNVLFQSNKRSAKALSKVIEAALSARFSYPARAVVLSYAQYNAAVESAPENWGKDALQKHNALFLLGDATVNGVVDELPPSKADVEHVSRGENVIFWSVSKERVTETSYMKLAKSPVYKSVTIRNHNTVFKLLQLFDEI